MRSHNDDISPERGRSLPTALFASAIPRSSRSRGDLENWLALPWQGGLERKRSGGKLRELCTQFSSHD
jgi:hypothetical protein